MKTQEQWKRVPIEGMENYQISNHGRLKTMRFNGGKLIAQHRLSKKGYPIARIREDKKKERVFFIHRLVAMAFIPNPNDYPQVNHKDCNKDNNMVENLEWCTNLMNAKHAKENGLIRGVKGEDHHSAKLTELEVIKIRDLFSLGFTRRQLAERFNTKPSNIKDIVLRRSWKHI